MKGQCEQADVSQLNSCNHLSAGKTSSFGPAVVVRSVTIVSISSSRRKGPLAPDFESCLLLDLTVVVANAEMEDWEDDGAENVACEVVDGDSLLSSSSI